MLEVPKVSVILSSFNHAKYLREAIDSVLSQTFENFELIIWDDASQDESWEIICSYADPRIKSFRNNETKRGVYGINKAISEVAQGEYIAIHHSDDVWMADKLEKQVSFLNAHQDIAAVFTNAQAIDELGAPYLNTLHYYYSVFNRENRSRHQWLRLFFEIGNALCHPSVLIRRHCYSDCGLYRYGLAQLGDFDMWIRLCLKHEIHVLPEKLVGFRVRDNEANSSGNRPETRARVLFEFSMLLPSYLQINQRDDLLKVFPEAEVFCSENENSVHYALARAMLEVRKFDFVVPFALNVIFEILNDPVKREQIDFDVNQFVKLTSALDPLKVIYFEQLNQLAVEREAQIAERDAQIAERGAQIIDRDAQIARREAQIVDRDAQIARREAQIADRDAQIAERSAQIAERDAQIAERGAQIAERDAQITERDGQIIERDAQITERDAQITERDGQIIERDAQITERDAQITERNVQITERNVQITERNAQITDRNAQIAERDAQITERDTQISERNTQINERDTQLAERDAQLAQRDAKLAERDAQIAERDAQLSERDVQLSEREDQLSHRENQLSECEAQLAAIHASKSWSCTKPLRMFSALMKRRKKHGSEKK
ncbi:glycosyltransferase [Pseudomonas fluorescens]|uniref:glycosyltransferase n=1 Tax=Pseudomonas fluorescens TaxID=294 RepID=UPI001782EEEE|nr:glycosyltransferase [Pseudomonas fluorescens]